MGSPSIDSFLELVRKARVVDESRLSPYIEKLQAVKALPSEPGRLAGLMVRDAILTQFQAEQILAGKWRGFHVGKYKILEKLGHGGMGTVYLAEHHFMKRRVAVKVLPKSTASDPSSLERFYREAKAVAALDHPNIVRAYDIDQDGELHFLVMEYVDGSSLQEIVKKTGVMSPLRAAHYIRQGAQALAHASEISLVHRDIKPGNLLVDRTGTVKILDMGLARFFNDEEDLITKKYDENVLGTADYLSPEQAIDSHNVDIRADIYSLGCTFYYTLTGKPPFGEGTVAQKLIWHQTRQPRPLKDWRNDVPDDLVTVINKMMQKAPEQRYQKPQQVVDALAPFTRTPIPPPTDDELPKLSPAAQMSASDGLNAPVSIATSKTSLKKESPPPKAMPAPSSSHMGKARPSEPGSPTRPAPAKTSPGPGRAAATRTAPAPVAALDNTPDPASAQAETLESFSGPFLHKLFEKQGSSLTLKQLKSLKFSKRTWALIGGIGGGIVAIITLVAVLLPSDPRRPNPNPVVPTAADIAAARAAAKIDEPPPKPEAAKPEVAPAVAGRTIYVSKTVPGDHRTLRDALAEARPGDRILVRDREVYEEQLLLTPSGLGKKGLTLEAEQGAILSPPGQGGADTPLLLIDRVEGLRVKGFTLNGQLRLNDLVKITGPCPGLTLEHVRLYKFNRAAVVLEGAGGARDREIRLQGVLFDSQKPAGQSAYSALLFAPVPQGTNDFLRVHECRFEGLCDAMIRLQAKLGTVVFEKNVFFGGKKDAIAYTPPTGQSYHIKFELLSNTFCDFERALYFRPMPHFSSRFEVSGNLFFQVKNVALLEETPPVQMDPMIAGEGNVREDKQTLPGNLLSLKLQPFTFTLPASRDNFDFLRYSAKSPLATMGKNAQPVGALAPLP